MKNDISKPERETQDRVIRLFRDTLKYDYLGDWDERENNSNIEDEQLRKYLSKQGYATDKINAAILKLKTEANNSGRSLYDNNEAVYKLLRYGVDVKTKADESTAKVWLVDWENPENNDFAVAEEVTLTQQNKISSAALPAFWPQEFGIKIDSIEFDIPGLIPTCQIFFGSVWTVGVVMISNGIKHKRFETVCV